MTVERKRERRLTHKRRTRRRTRRREPAGPGAVGGPTQWGAKAQPHCVFLPYISPSHSLHSLLRPRVLSVFSLPPTRVCSSRYLSEIAAIFRAIVVRQLPRYFCFLFWHYRLASVCGGGL